MYRFDYHMHSKHSFDANYSPKEMAESAARAGLSEICFTEHVDFDWHGEPPCMRDYFEEVRRLMPAYRGVRIRIGVEIGLKDEQSAREAWDFLKDYELDFIIGSVHFVDGVDAYYPEFYSGLTQKEAYRKYVGALKGIAESCPYFNVLGHYDFVAKYAPYPSRALEYSDFRDELDGVLNHLIQSGRGLEINTSAWRQGPAWGLALFKRYARLGGLFVTTGADAHAPDKVGNRINEAVELARAAGVPYIATFEKMKPVFHKL